MEFAENDKPEENYFSSFFEEESGQFRNFPKEHHKILTDCLKDLIPEPYKNKEESLKIFLSENNEDIDTIFPHLEAFLNTV